MSNVYPTSPRATGVDTQDAAHVNAFLSRVLWITCLAIAAMGGAAYLIAASPELTKSLFGLAVVNGKMTSVEGGSPGITLLVSFIGMMALIFGLSAAVQSRSTILSFTLLMALAGLMGMISAPLVLKYTGATLLNVFITTSAVFASAALYGVTTKRDMTSWGSVLFLCLLGLIIAMVVNMFMLSSAMDFAISSIAVVLFTVLTAYDIQQAKVRYATDGGSWSVAVMCACELYLDFANLFIHLLRLMGGGGKD